MASIVVQLLIRIVVRNYQRSVIEHLRRLYALREANSVPGTAEYRRLTLARRQLDRVTEDLSRRSGGLPAFLVGGAALSAASSSTVQEVTGSRLVLLVVAAVTVALAVAAFWCVITAAAIARRRTRIALDAPLRALYETIGAAGDPPRDRMPRRRRPWPWWPCYLHICWFGCLCSLRGAFARVEVLSVRLGENEIPSGRDYIAPPEIGSPRLPS